MSCKRIGDLLMERMAGTLGDDDERIVREHLASCESCRQEADELAQTWSMLDGIGEERSTESMRVRFYEMLTEVQEEERRMATEQAGLLQWIRGLWPRQPIWQVGIAAAMLVFGLWMGPRLGSDKTNPEIEALRSEMQSMTRAVSLSLLEHQSASERLRAVSLTESAAGDSEVTQALIRVITEDESVNVRLAALGVLSDLLDRPDVRTGLLDALGQQKTPMMQAAMADVLLASRDAESRSALERLSKDEAVHEDVRSFIREALNEGENRI